MRPKRKTRKFSKNREAFLDGVSRTWQKQKDVQHWLVRLLPTQDRLNMPDGSEPARAPYVGERLTLKSTDTAEEHLVEVTELHEWVNVVNGKPLKRGIVCVKYI